MALTAQAREGEDGVWARDTCSRQAAPEGVYPPESFDPARRWETPAGWSTFLVRPHPPGRPPEGPAGAPTAGMTFIRLLTRCSVVKEPEAATAAVDAAAPPIPLSTRRGRRGRQSN